MDPGIAVYRPFFKTVPPVSSCFSLAISVLAAIVASKAMITSSSQLPAQAMCLPYFPHIRTVHAPDGDLILHSEPHCDDEGATF